MDAYVLDWVNLLLRWAHVIVAIAWIGSSFYFVFLDNSLTPPPGFGWRLTVDDARRITGYIKTLWTDDQRMMQARTTQQEMELLTGP